MNHLARSISLMAVCSVGAPVAAVCRAGPPTVEQGEHWWKVGEDLSQVSLFASDAPLTAILRDLRMNRGVEVRLDRPTGARVTAQIESRPLDDVLARIVPEGVRYVVRWGEREVPAQPDGRGEKRGEPEARPGSAPTKDKTTPLTDGEKLVAKAAPDDPPRPAKPNGDLKPDPGSVREVPDGSGPKKPLGRDITERSLRLRFSLTIDHAVTLQSAILLEGGMVRRKPIGGGYLFAVRVGGRTVDLGSFIDPLEEHRYEQKGGRHDAGRLREGTFGVTLSGEFAEAARLEQTTIEFFDVRERELPLALDAKGFDGWEARGKAFAVIEGKSVAQALREKGQ
jgi:hypothetical protein